MSSNQSMCEILLCSVPDRNEISLSNTAETYSIDFLLNDLYCSITSYWMIYFVLLPFLPVSTKQCCCLLEMLFCVLFRLPRDTVQTKCWSQSVSSTYLKLAKQAGKKNLAVSLGLNVAVGNKTIMEILIILAIILFSICMSETGIFIVDFLCPYDIKYNQFLKRFVKQ